MAIPFNLPTDEETEDNYRSLDQLILDLYHVLRQILLRPRTNVDLHAGDRGGGGAAPSGSRPVAVAADVTRSRRPVPDLPDVVSSTLGPECQCPCQRERRRPQRRHRRRRQPSSPSCCVPQPPHHSASCESQVRRVQLPVGAPRREENWLIIGEQLRKIAEEFKTTFRKEEEAREQNEDLKMEVKTSGLFSLLVPAHFRNSIWTTVILLVGWRLLVRSR